MEILDSSGSPTLRAFVRLKDGTTAAASVPAGKTSAGPKEAAEVRDGDKNRYSGLGMLQGVKRIAEDISPILSGRDPTRQAEIDQMLIELDGTFDKSVLGAGVTLAVSMAVARAGAAAGQLPLYAYLGGPTATRLPMPMIDILNGGVHADNSVDFEEFMVVPVGAQTFSQAIRMGAEIFQALRRILMGRGHRTVVGDQGGFAPNLTNNEKAFEVIVEAIQAAGYEPGTEVAIAVDVAAGQFYDAASRMYNLRWSGKWSPKSARTRAEMIGFLGYLIQRYPIISIEDGLASSDWAGFVDQMGYFGGRIQIVGDDLYASHGSHIREGIAAGATNAIVVRLAQVGTVSEAIQAVHLCRQAGWAFVIADRATDTEDSFTADFAVAMGAGQIKSGSTCLGERISKYNRLLEIEEELGHSAVFQSPLSWTPSNAAAQQSHNVMTK
jgi:enolase